MSLHHLGSKCLFEIRDAQLLSVEMLAETCDIAPNSCFLDLFLLSDLLEDFIKLVNDGILAEVVKRVFVTFEVAFVFPDSFKNLKSTQ